MPLIATRGAASAQGFGEFAQAAVAPVYIEDVFSTYLYTGNGSTQTITNGIDLSTKGGLVWIKSRGSAVNHALADTVRGANNRIASNTTAAQIAGGVTAFNTNGFNIDNEPQVNSSSTTYVSWSLREQPKFFDIVTYTGNGSNRTIAHNLGSVPGCIIIKRTDAIEDWNVYHRSLANTQYMILSGTAAALTGTTRWNSTTPTDTVFSLGTSTIVNASGGTYVAYIFAHDAGGFGLTGTDNVISCGSFTYNSTSGNTINLGYEPQWILVKNATDVTQWYIQDTMRGMTADNTGNRLFPNLSSAEDTSGFFGVNASGFKLGAGLFTNGDNIIYVAIRRGPMAVPTTGTSVFSPVIYSGNSGTQSITTNFPVDLEIVGNRTTGGQSWAQGFLDRLRGNGLGLASASTAAEANYSADMPTEFQSNTGVNRTTAYYNATGFTFVDWAFRRAPSFFDEVCYTGTGTARTINHNLGVVPELIIVKARSNAGASWSVYSKSLTVNQYILLDSSSGFGTFNLWNATAPTSSVFSVSTYFYVNEPAYTYVAYLFATCAGVSKVGSYTGTGATQTIDCGFGAGGARFVLIKRTDATGDWYVYDTARGMTALTDPYLLANSTAAETATLGSVTTVSTGFAVNAAILAAINTNAATYIFLAVA